MAATVTTIDKLLKAQYLPEIIDGFQEGHDLLSELMKNTVPAYGDEFEALVRVGRNGSMGARADGDPLPGASRTKGNSSWVRHTLAYVADYATIEVSGQSMARTEGGSQKAFLKSLVAEMEHTLKHWKKRMNYKFWGGGTGYLGKIGTVNDGSDFIQLDMPGTAGQKTSVNFNAGTRFFPIAGDIKIDIVDSDGSTIHLAGLTITAVDHSTAKLSFGTTDLSAVADGDFVVADSGLTAGSDTWSRREVAGIQEAIDDGDVLTSYFGLSRSTYPTLKSNVLKNTSALRDISEGLLEDLLKAVAFNCGVDPRTGGGYELVMSPGMHSEFVQNQLGFKRYQGNALKPGYSSIDYSGIPIRIDVDAPYEEIYLLKLSNFVVPEVHPVRWLDEDGPVLSRVTDYDAYEGRLRWYGNLFARDVHEMGVIRNVNETPVTWRF